MLLLGANSTGSHGGEVAEAVDFDGTNDYLSRSSDLTGNADGKTFTFSAWVWNVSDQYLYAAHNGSVFTFRVYNTGGTEITINAANTAGTVIFSANVTQPKTRYTFIHLLVSVDLSNTSNRSIYINDVPQSVTWTTFTNDTIDFTVFSHRLGATSTAASGSGRLSHLYLDYTYRDLSVEANRRLFITADRKPADNQEALNPILYLKMESPDTVGVNSGTGGNFTLNGVVARSGRGANQFNAPYSDLDGSADYLSRTSLTGIADGKQFTFACCFNADDVTTSQHVFATGNIPSARVTIIFGSGYIRFVANNVAGTAILTINIATGIIAIGRNHFVVASFDLSSTANRRIYVDGVDVTPASGWTYTNDTIDFTTTGYRIGASIATTPGAFVNGRLGNVFFHTSYIDLSQAANLEKFCVGTGIDCKPVDMGANGELPLGTSPLIYLPMYANNAGKNYGTGGDFTVNSGPYTGARGPNEFWGNKADFDGSTGYLARTSALAGVSDGKTFSASFFFRQDVNGADYVFSIRNGTTLGMEISVSGTYVRFTGANSAGTIILSLDSVTTVTAGQTYHVCAMFDMSSASLRSIWVDGVGQGLTNITYTNDTLKLAGDRITAGARYTGSYAGFFDGPLSEFYFTTSYIDFIQEANRLKFRDAFGNPVDLTPQIEAGEIPEPAIYMRFDPANQGKNYGTGGDFTKSGTILDGGQL